MFNCPKCGKAVRSEGDYCPNCGEYIMLKYRGNKSLDTEVCNDKSEQEGLIKNNRNSSSNNSNIPFLRNKKFIFSFLIFIFIIISFIVFNKTPTLTGSYQGIAEDDGTSIYVKYAGEKIYLSIEGEHFMVFDKISEKKSTDEEVNIDFQQVVFQLNKTATDDLINGSDVSNFDALFAHLVFTDNHETKPNLGFTISKYESLASVLMDPSTIGVSLTKIDNSAFPEIVEKKSRAIEKDNTTEEIKDKKTIVESSSDSIENTISTNIEDITSSELQTFADGLPIYSSGQPINNSVGTYRYSDDTSQTTVTILSDGTYFSTSSALSPRPGEITISYVSGPVGAQLGVTSLISVDFSNVEDYMSKSATKTTQLFQGDFYENGILKMANFGWQGLLLSFVSRNEDSLVISGYNGETMEEMVYDRVPDEYQYTLEEIIKDYEPLVLH